jgi:hypothetical protein
MYTKNTIFLFKCCYFNKEYSKLSKYPSNIDRHTPVSWRSLSANYSQLQCITTEFYYSSSISRQKLETSVLRTTCLVQDGGQSMKIRLSTANRVRIEENTTEI